MTSVLWVNRTRSTNSCTDWRVSGHTYWFCRRPFWSGWRQFAVFATVIGLPSFYWRTMRRLTFRRFHRTCRELWGAPRMKRPLSVVFVTWRVAEVSCLVRSSHVLEERQDPVGTRVRKRLAPSELRIISLVVQGFRNREIALQMSTSEQSIKNSLRKIFDKTGVSGRLELALYVVHHRALKQAAAEAEPTQDMRSLAAIQLEWLSPLRTFIN